MGVDVNQFKHICDNIRIGLDFTPLGEREKLIIKDFVVAGYTSREVGERFGITSERVRQIYNRALRRLSGSVRVFALKQEEMQEEIAKLRTENLRLQMHNTGLKQLLEKAGCCNCDSSENLTEIQLRLLATPVKQLDVTIRLLNCLKSAGVERLGDVLNMGKKQLLKYRNFGKKSLRELNELFADHGLELKDYSPDVHVLLHSDSQDRGRVLVG